LGESGEMERRSNSGHWRERERERERVCVCGGRDQKFSGIAVRIFRDREALLWFFGLGKVRGFCELQQKQAYPRRKKMV